MRISDWSSDVCSSDLENRGSSFGLAGREPAGRRPQRGVSRQPVDEDRPLGRRRRIEVKSRGDRVGIVERGGGDIDFAGLMTHMDGRSEEHTSELQSLMRISYAVFCLKKKKTRQYLTPSATGTDTAHTA